MTPMTKAQSDVALTQVQAQYRGTKDGVEWWWVPGGRYWVGRRALQDGRVELGKFAAGSCNC